MALPGTNINVLNNQLGKTAGTDDGIAGLIVTGPTPTSGNNNFSIGEVRQIFSTEDAQDGGFDASYDSNNSVDAWAQIKDFYSEAGEGAELWVMLVSQTETLENICDKVNSLATKLLDQANGKIKFWGVSRVPDGSYSPTYNDGLDDDVTAAIPKAQALTTEYANQFKPTRAIIGGRDFQGVVADLKDLRQGTDNRVGVSPIGIEENSQFAMVGRILGRMARIPVQRSIGRVKDGDIGLSEAYLSDGNALEDYSLAEIEKIHDKGYIVLRTYQGKNGYFFAGMPAATAIDDDYAWLNYGRVIDKGIRLTYATYTDELLDDIEVNPKTGKMEASVIKAYQSKINRVINQQMTNNGELSGVKTVLDPEQDVISNDEIQVSINLVPKGYARTISADLAFSNPNV